MRQDLQKDSFFTHIGLLILCLLPSLLLTTWGLGRPYDAIPDQDLLWASEALRGMRGVAPSYADHPGAFWSIVFRININALELLKDTEIVDSLGRITTDGIKSLIATSRIENGIICGTTAYLLFPLSKALSIPTRLSALISLITAYSSAILVGVSEIRHETIALAFLMLSAILFNQAAKQPRATIPKYIYTAGSLAMLFASAFSKNQTLLLFPLYFAACIGILNRKNSLWPQFTPIQKPLILTKRLAVFASIAGLAWAISAVPDIDLINLPFWAAINTGLALLISLQLFRKATWKSCYISLLISTIFQTTLFRLLSPQWWRQSITGFPSWMFRYANASEEPETNAIHNTLKGIYQYFSAISLSAPLAILIITVVIVALLTRLPRLAKSPFSEELQQQAGACYAWFFCFANIVANSQRIAARYEIYILVPLAIIAAYTTTAFRTKDKTFTFNTHSAIAMLSAGIITLIGLRSMLNIRDLHSFVLEKQPREWVCIGHHMDKSMALTSAGKCKVFQRASKEKNDYDSWLGPR